MKLEVPVIAYDSTAVGETMGEAGIKLKDKDLQMAAEWVDQICSNKILKTKVINDQKNRLEHFSTQRVEGKFRKIMESFVK